MEKPVGWFLLAKYAKNTCGHRPASLLEMSHFHRWVFFTHFPSKNQPPGALVGNGLKSEKYLQWQP